MEKRVLAIISIVIWAYAIITSLIAWINLESNSVEGLRNRYAWSDPDDGMWVLFVQETLEKGTPPLRTAQDNFGEGRDIGWSPSLMRVWALTAKIYSLLTGTPKSASVEITGIFLNTFILATFSTFILWLRPKARGLLAIGPLMLWYLSEPIQEAFCAFHPDHQGVLLILNLATLSAILVAQTTGNWKWGILGGLCGGSAIGISAATGVLGLFIAGLCTFITFFFQIPKEDNSAKTWRAIGWSGGLASFLFWLWDRYPHILYAFETNGPFHASALLGASHLLAILSEKRQGRRIRLLDAVLACGIIPMILAIIVLQGDFVRSQTPIFKQLMWAIAELQPIKNPDWFLYIPCLSVPYFLIRRVSSSKRRASDLWVIILCVIGIALGYSANRFEALAFSMALLIGGYYLLWTSPKQFFLSFQAVTLTALIITIPLSVQPWWDLTTGKVQRSSTIDGKTAAALAKEVASDTEGTLIADPDVSRSTRIKYYLPDDIKVGGTIYWECALGIEKLAALFANGNIAEAESLLYKLHVSHIVLKSSKEILPLIVAAHGSLEAINAQLNNYSGYSGAEWLRQTPEWLEPCTENGLWKINREVLLKSIKGNLP